MKQKKFEDGRVPQAGPLGWMDVPTTETPSGSFETGVNTANGWVFLVAHTNETFGAFARDMTPRQARWLAQALEGAADAAETEDFE